MTSPTFCSIRFLHLCATLFLLFAPSVLSQSSSNDTRIPGYDWTLVNQNVSEKIACLEGWYCPGGNIPARRCRNGMYCPSFATEDFCPSGYICKLGYTQPIKCPPTFICPEGSKRHFFFGGIIVLVGFLALLAGMHQYVLYKDNRLRSVEYVKLSSSEQEANEGIQASEAALSVIKQEEVQVSIRFEKLGVRVRSRFLGKKNKTIVGGVSGEFKAGSLCAIMGPSGCGKSVFLQALTGKIAHTDGSIFLNGKKESLRKWRNLMGFVPQDDIMLRNLTVFENLLHSALTRLPASWPAKHKRAYAEWTIDKLGLSHCRDTLIGDEYMRGVSGGERKRVNIGIELVANPRAIFLDEPTSGLDATTSQDLISVLKSLASSGILIVTTITQPRYEIFEMLDTVLLLGNSADGGRPVYFGPAVSSISYITDLGFPIPAVCNPADFILDAVSGKVPNTKAPSLDLPLMWTTHSNDREADSNPAAQKSIKSVKTPSKPNFFQQTGACLQRIGRQRMHGFMQPLVHILLQAVAGLIIGMAVENQDMFIPPLPRPYADYCNYLIYRFCRDADDYVLANSLIGFMSMAVALVASTIGVLTFSDEREVFWREAGSGANTLSYYVAKCLADLPAIAAGSLVLVSVYFMVASPIGTFGNYFAIVVLYEFALYAMGYVCTALLPNKAAASLLAATASLVAGLGASPQPSNDVAWSRWLAEALYITEVRNDLLDPATQASFAYYLQQLADASPPQNWDLNNFGTCCIALVIFGLVFRVMAYILLRVVRYDKQR